MDADALSSATDLCVKCGLCLPHCPTYRLSQDESESPRGRLALIQGWSLGQLDDSKALQSHIGHCLLCRNCETVCPAKVPYAAIVDAFREQTLHSPHKTPPRLLSRLARWSLRSPLLTADNGLQQRFAGVAAQLGHLPGAPSLLRALARRAPTQQTETTTNPPPRLQVGIFTGCTAHVLDQQTLDSICKLLPQLGVAVHLPQKAVCCGALDQHAGRTAEAGKRAQATVSAFNWQALDFVVHFASGCAAQLIDHQQLTGLPTQRFMDISHFLATQIPDTVWKHLKPLDHHAYLHTPCTMRNGCKDETWPLKLLQQIPGLRVTSLSAQGQCCGAAGSHMLDHPQQAKLLRDALISPALQSSPADFMLTSNPGCALHLQAGLPNLEVLHPVTLVARQFSTLTD